MVELQDVPLDSQSRVDIVPVDFVALGLERLLRKKSLRHQIYHLSAGLLDSASCAELRDALRAIGLEIRLVGSKAWHSHSFKDGFHRRLIAALEYYLPFLNADIVYSRCRLVEELGKETPVCMRATEFIGTLMEQVSDKEAFRESVNP
jgi:hypothetical protein